MGSQTLGWVRGLLRGPQGSGARASPAPRQLATQEAGVSDPGKGSDATPQRIFAVGMALRVAFLTTSGAYAFRPDYFGWEAGRIASSLAAGRGFCDPFQGTTGPTSWVAPLYPVLLAGIFRAFGTYSRLSGWVALTFNSACSVLTAVILYLLGRELFGERTGRAPVGCGHSCPTSCTGPPGSSGTRA